jgi:hypothetical protein
MAEDILGREYAAIRPESQKLLRNQVIDETHPGSILRDFQTLLEFIGEGIPAAGRHRLLPMKMLADLNARMTRPIELRLRRPQQRSYPYINGLFLVLRATGLLRAEGGGTKARLVLDPELLASWRGLNPTERYFTLLEAWLLRAQAEFIGQGRGSHYGMYLDVFQLWDSVGPQGLNVRPDREWCFSGDRGHNPALMDLFGLLDVERGRPRQGEPWCPARVERRAFGNALLELLRGYLFAGALWVGEEEQEEPPEDDGDQEEAPDDEEDVELGDTRGAVGFGQLQPVLQPYFPEWRNNLVSPKPEELRNGVFVFKVSLGDSWRRIAIPATCDLDDLADGILESVDFDHDHLWCFEYRDPRGPTVRAEGPRCAAPYCHDLNILDVLIGELPLEMGQSMTFLYDFGDNWLFNVRLERVGPPGETRRRATLLEAQGDPPLQYPDWGDEGLDEDGEGSGDEGGTQDEEKA